jgi:preprotein translocase subunit SecA
MSEAILKSWGVTDRSAGPYAERRDPEPASPDRVLLAGYGGVALRLAPGERAFRGIVDCVDAQAREISGMSDRALRAAAEALQQPLMRRGFQADLVAQAFALVREAATRHVGLRHYPVQLIGGLAMLKGMLAEMETGEGKTITATLPAVTVALAGMPVHVITVNDYLAQRDAELLRPLYQAFGLGVGLVQHGQDPEARRAAYACDITYGTNKDIVFDYLRDRLALGDRRALAALQLDEIVVQRHRSGRLLLRGLHFAIVDEADNVLIDEARTPLIISGQEGDARGIGVYEEALAMAEQLEHGEDFHVVANERTIRLTPRGRERLTRLASGFDGPWRARRAREEMTSNALSALHLYQRDKQYVIADDKVQIVDEFTGRVMPDRSWERGLHQMIEAKEGCAITGSRSTLARITYQRFFRRYLRLAGMTGTAKEAAGELLAVYGLRVARIPTNRPIRRSNLGMRVYRSAGDKWQAVVASVRETALEQGRPVLIGTRSVAASEQLSALLHAAGLEHVVLNARQNREEAEVVARAGQKGRITVATNMAGRGTDIRLASGVADLGGLHVVLTEFHEAKRIDRQLFGRAGRQGDPGSFEAIVALDDELFIRFARRASHILSGRVRATGDTLLRPAAVGLRHLAQAAAERTNSRIRRETVRHDARLDKTLAFAGKGE